MGVEIIISPYFQYVKLKVSCKLFVSRYLSQYSVLNTDYSIILLANLLGFFPLRLVTQLFIFTLKT